VNRYRKLDMTVGEKEMVIAELQAKYVNLISFMLPFRALLPVTA